MFPRSCCARVLLSLLASVFSLTAGETKDPAEKPDPKTKARQLLDASLEMLSAAKPEIQATGLHHASGGYELLDGKRALALAKQAFTAAAALPPEHSASQREGLMADIVSRTAGLSVPDAVEMLRAMPAPSAIYPDGYDRRCTPMAAIVRTYLAKQSFDEAIALVDFYGGAGAYCFDCAARILEKLPADDPRRGQVFAAAVAGYRVRPFETFVTLVAGNWRGVPRPLLENAVDALVSAILDRKKTGEIQRWGFVTAKGLAVFDTVEEASFFRILHVVRDINPKRAEEILSKHPSLRPLAEQYPKGIDSLTAKGELWTFIVSGDDKAGVDRLTQQQRGEMLGRNRAMAVLNMAEEDAAKAVEMVKTIPNPQYQAETLGAIARRVAAQDADLAGPLLSRCWKAIEELKSPANRVEAWDALADAANLANDKALADRVLDRAFTDAAELARLEEKAPLPNPVLRDYWPSTQAYRRVVSRAAAIHGVDAEPLLAKIADTDVNLLARLALADALLGKPLGRLRVYAPRTGQR